MIFVGAHLAASNRALGIRQWAGKQNDRRVRTGAFNQPPHLPLNPSPPTISENDASEMSEEARFIGTSIEDPWSDIRTLG